MHNLGNLILAHSLDVGSGITCNYIPAQQEAVENCNFVIVIRHLRGPQPPRPPSPTKSFGQFHVHPCCLDKLVET